MGKTLILHHKEFAGLEYGPDRDSAIIFGPRAGHVPGYAEVDEDHPLLSQLLTDPNVEVVTDELGTQTAWISPVEPGRTFKSKQALVAHVRAAANKGDAMATAWLSRFSGDDPSAGSRADVSEAPGDGGTHTSPLSNVIQQDPVSPPHVVKPTFGAGD